MSRDGSGEFGPMYRMTSDNGLAMLNVFWLLSLSKSTATKRRADGGVVAVVLMVIIALPLPGGKPPWSTRGTIAKPFNRTPSPDVAGGTVPSVSKNLLEVIGKLLPSDWPSLLKRNVTTG